MNNFIKLLKRTGLFVLLILWTGSAVLLTAQTTVNINPDIRYQKTEGWGTSLCWFGNVIGKWSDAKRNAVADLLFDAANGLGINLIRYNIGGGDAPSHNHMGYGKEMDGFKTTENGAYDWNADPGQRWMLQAAKTRIASGEFISEAFANSPPYWMTNSGCASGGNGNNLKSGYYDDFADYLTEVVRHFRDSWGINFRTLEPMNEPNLGWGANGGQEGCHFDRSLQDDIIREVKAKLNSKSLSTLIAAMDETNIDDTITSYNSYDSTTRSYIFQINTHVYSGSNRQGLKQLATNEGKKLWQSECDGSGAPAPFDVFTHNHNDIAPGLDLAMRITRDMRQMQPDGWIFWQAVESEQAQTNLNKNWGLLHADFEKGTESYYMTKKYYTMAQYTKFIRPGYIMIDINNTDAIAFLGEEQGKLVIVQRNAGTSDVSFVYNLTGFSTLGTSAAVYRTSASENYQHLSDVTLSGTQLRVTGKAQSITTYVLSGVSVGGSTGEVISVNDNTTGTGLNQFEYSGSWSYGSQTGAYQSDNHWDSDAGGYYQVRFNGTGIEVYAAIASNHGIAAISIDGGSETMVDLYASARSDQYLIYTSPVLDKGNHTLKVRVTGNRNSASGGATITADMVRIIVAGNTTPAPTATPSPTLVPTASFTASGRPGDVNNDGSITIVDALMTAQYFVGLNPPGFNSANADVNRDGQITIVDALMIAQFYVGLISSFN